MHKDDLPSNLPSVENTDSSAVPPDSATMDFPADREHQGIFSSNDTRIETENLPDIPEVAQQAPMSSITPALRTTSTVTGDLKLGGAPKKKRWPMILVGIVAVIAIVTAVTVLLSSGQKGASEVNGKLAEYAERLNRVPSGVEWDQESSDNHFAEDLINAAVELDQTQLTNYIDSLDEAILGLSDTTQRIYGNSKRESAQYIVDDATKLANTNSMLKIFLQVSSMLEDLDAILMRDGIEVALESIPKYDEVVDGDMTTYLVHSSLSGYMEAYLRRNSFFMQNGCYINGVTIDGCMQKVSEANAEVATEADIVARNFSQARNYLYQAGNTIYGMINQYIDEMQIDLEGVK